MTRTALVTGASGFVGQHLLRLLAAEGGWSLHAWTRDVVPDGPPARWTVLEMADPDVVARGVAAVRPDVVFHLAGAAHVGQSFGNVTETLATNVMGTATLFEGLRRHGLAPRVLVTGSALVYRPAERALDESSAIGPSSPYGLSKLAQERLSIAAHAEDGLPVVVVRSFNHIGPGQAPSFFAPSFARQLAEIEAGQRPPRLTVGNLDARRDLTDVRDTVRAYRLLVEHGAPGEVYNMCSGVAHRVGDILDGLVARTRVGVEVVVDASLLRPNDNPLVLGSSARLQAATGWTPTIPIDQTLSDLLDDWRGRVRTTPAGPA